MRGLTRKPPYKRQRAQCTINSNTTDEKNYYKQIPGYGLIDLIGNTRCYKNSCGYPDN